MAVIAHLFTEPVSASGRPVGCTLSFVCDTEVELPSADVINGDVAFTKDSKKDWERIAGAWVESVDYAPLFTAAVKGLVPASGGGTTNYLRADGTFAAPGGGSGVAWREFCLLADSAGVAMTNIGTSFVQVGVNSLRNKVDLTGFADCRIVIGVNKVGSGTQDWKIQYSTDGSTFTDDLTGAVSDAGAAGEKLLVGTFAAIPAGAQADVWIRVVGKSTTAADDPVVKSCKLHVK